ncbi:MAG: terminase small subunit [Candidatus Peribacter sp.]|jgi:phage terminase small subunit
MEAIEELTPSKAKAIAFVEAYLDEGFNATAAAKRVCKIGVRGGENPQRSAEVVGSRMLRNVEVRKILAQRLQDEHTDRTYVLERLYYFSQHADSERNKIRATEMLGKALGMFSEGHRLELINISAVIQEIEHGAPRVDWDRTGEP